MNALTNPKIEKSGTWPLMKYILRADHGHYSVIVIDDKAGDTFIYHGSHGAFHHWWGQNGRASDKLREFLVRASVPYLSDKFSYGQNTWYAESALKDLKEKLVKEIGDEHTWDEELVTEVEELDGNFSTSEGLYFMLNDRKKIMDIIGDDYPSGEEGVNRDVKYFMQRSWPHFVEYWKKELETEATTGKALEQ